MTSQNNKWSTVIRVTSDAVEDGHIRLLIGFLRMEGFKIWHPTPSDPITQDHVCLINLWLKLRFRATWTYQTMRQSLRMPYMNWVHYQWDLISLDFFTINQGLLILDSATHGLIMLFCWWAMEKAMEKIIGWSKIVGDPSGELMVISCLKKGSIDAGSSSGWQEPLWRNDLRTIKFYYLMEAP